MAPKTKNANKGKKPAASAPATNPHGIKFRDDKQEARYNILCSRRMLNTRYMDKMTMKTLGIDEDVEWMLGQINVLKFFQLTPQTFVPLVLEFFSSLEVELDDGYEEEPRGRLTFRLANIERSLSLRDVRNILTLPSGGTARPTKDYVERAFWYQVGNDSEFSVKTARASSLSNPCLRYVHRILAHTVFGRGESDGMIRQTELYFLWCMLHGHQVDIAYYLVKHFDKVARAHKGAIVVGGYIAPIAVALKVDPYGVETAKGNPKLDLESCVAMRMIIHESHGFSLVLGPDTPALPLPDKEKLTVRNQLNWRISPDAATKDIPTPLDSVPPPPPFTGVRYSWMDDDSPMPRSGASFHGATPRSGASSHGATPQRNWSTTQDPGFQALSAEVFSQGRLLKEMFGVVRENQEDIRGIKSYIKSHFGTSSDSDEQMGEQDGEETESNEDNE